VLAVPRNDDLAHMEAFSRARFAALCLHLIVTGAALTIPVAARPPLSRTAQTAAGQPAAIQEFQRRLQIYLDLREAVSQKLKPLAPTPSAADLAARQNALAAAIRAARAGARPGDAIPPAVAALIARSIAEDFTRRTPAEERAAFTEVPNAGQPAINGTYPADAALPPIPPLLLLNLPRLPDSLQYRFYGRHLLLLDSDVQIVVDYVANVLPPH
jgi:hypothetical protein